MVVVKASFNQVLTRNTASTWLSDSDTLLTLEALGDAWQNDAAYVTVDTAVDTFTLAPGTWRITIEASGAYALAGNGEAIVAGIYSSGYSLVLGVAGATAAASGITIPGNYNDSGTNPCPIGTITDIKELASATTFGMHATMTPNVTTRLGHMHVVCERLGD